MVNDPNEEIEIPDWLRQPEDAPLRRGPSPGAPPEGAPPLEPAELPDWLVGMQPGAQPPEEPPPEEPVFIAEPPPQEVPEEPPEEESPLDGLRAQAMEADLGELEKTRKQGLVRRLVENLRGRRQEKEPKEARRVRRSGLAGVLGGLAPWQRFVLALLLFLDVVIVGCMCLIMTGRIVPFQ